MEPEHKDVKKFLVYGISWNIRINLYVAAAGRWTTQAACQATQRLTNSILGCNHNAIQFDLLSQYLSSELPVFTLTLELPKSVNIENYLVLTSKYHTRNYHSNVAFSRNFSLLQTGSIQHK